MSAHDYAAEAKAFRRKHIADWLERAFLQRALGQEVQVEVLDTALASLLERLCREVALVPEWPKIEPVVESHQCPKECIPGCHVVTVGGYEVYHGISRALGERNPEWVLSRLCAQLSEARAEVERLKVGVAEHGRAILRAQKAEAALEQAKQDSYDRASADCAACHPAMFEQAFERGKEEGKREQREADAPLLEQVREDNRQLRIYRLIRESK